VQIRAEQFGVEIGGASLMKPPARYVTWCPNHLFNTDLTAMGDRRFHFEAERVRD